jgi:hypothetical protein
MRHPTTRATIPTFVRRRLAYRRPDLAHEQPRPTPPPMA